LTLNHIFFDNRYDYTYIISKGMPRIEEGITGAPLTLHDAVTHYECKICGEPLEWNLGFNKALNQPTYTSMHCNLEYEIIIDTVKIRILKPSKQLREQEMHSKDGIIEANKKSKKQQEEKIRMQIPAEHEPRAITMAKVLKEKRKREQLAQDKNKAEEEEEVIEELESQGDLKEDVPVGGEEFEAEAPRQGS
jgi:hypothetical protein